MIQFACMELMWGGLEPKAVDGWLAEIAGLGFEGAAMRYATLKSFFADPAGFRARLGQHRLQLVAGYLPITDPAAVADLDRLCDFLKAVGCGDLVVHGTPARNSGADPVALAHTIAGYGARATRRGVRVSFHHHANTLYETLEEYEVLLKATDPQQVALFLDTGHATQDFTGHPVAERAQLLLERHATRPRFVEFKAWTPETTLNAELGQGPLNLDGVVDWLVAHGHTGWITLEQNSPVAGATPGQCAGRSLAVAKAAFDRRLAAAR